MSEIRDALTVAEPLAEGDPEVRVPLVVAEPVAEGSPDVRVALTLNEPLAEGDPVVRVAMVCLEVLESIPEEGEMATDLFPMGLGLSWTTHKVPNFNTQVKAAANLKTARNSLTPYPAWDFEVSFVYLEDDDGNPNTELGTTDLKHVLGFFLDKQGRFKAFLHRDPKDYRVRGHLQATGDGVTTEFSFVRVMGPWREPVGQVDLLAKFSFAPADVTAGADSIAEAAHGLATGDGPFFVATTGALPAGLAASTPYWAIAATADGFKLAASEADALAGTPVDLTTQGTGVHSLTGGYALYADGVPIAPADFTFAAPNGFTLDVAAAEDVAITGDFDFYFVCHFLDDRADFEQFNRDLFQLQQVQFRADPAP